MHHGNTVALYAMRNRFRDFLSMLYFIYFLYIQRNQMRLHLFVYVSAIAMGLLVATPAFAEHERVQIDIQPQGAACTANEPCFTPDEITIDAGTEVVWYNGDSIPRTVTIAALGDCSVDIDACTFPSHEHLINTAPIFADITLNENGHYSVVFDEAGTYPFYDNIHARVPGTITAQEPDDAKDHRTVTIGGVFDITGSWSLVGDETKTAAEIAARDFNKFLHAVGADWRLNILMEDSQASGAVALEKVQSLNGRGVNILVGMALSSHLRAAYSYIDNSDMLVMSCCSTAANLAIDDYIFRLRPDDSRQAPAMNAMLNNAQIEVVYMINRNDAWGDGFKNGIRNLFGGTFVEGISFDPNQRDFSAEASIIDADIGELIDEYGAEKVGVFYVGFDELLLLIETLQNYEHSSQVRWFGSNTQAGADQFITNSASLTFFEETNFTAVKTVTPDNLIRQYLDGEIRNIYDREPSIYSHSAYDSVWILGYAIHMTQSTDPDTLKDVIPLVTDRMVGSFGHLRFNSAGDVASESYEVWSVHDGKWVKEYDYNASSKPQ